jgi:hypothetical protein
MTLRNDTKKYHNFFLASYRAKVYNGIKTKITLTEEILQ